MLKKSDINIVKLAMNLGYSNLSNFARAFKYITGVSPSVFRENVKAGACARPVNISQQSKSY